MMWKLSGNVLKNWLHCVGALEVWIQIYACTSEHFPGESKDFPHKEGDNGANGQDLLEWIVIRFRLMITIDFDKGLAFVSALSQELANYLGTSWKPNSAYRPQI